MTSRTSDSPNRKMFSSISPWLSSTVPSASPTSINIRSSPSVMVGVISASLPPSACVSTRGTRVKIQTSGPVIRISMRTGRDTTWDQRSATTTATAFGVNSAATTTITVAPSVATATTPAELPHNLMTSAVPTAVMMMLKALPMSKIVPKNLLYSSVILTIASDDWSPCSARWRTRNLLTAMIAASDALIRALPITAATMINIDRVIPRLLLVGRFTGGVRRRPCYEEFIAVRIKAPSQEGASKNDCCLRRPDLTFVLGLRRAL